MKQGWMIKEFSITAEAGKLDISSFRIQESCCWFLL
jgi:hypothetical protein